jgi:SAM-dependent methyltransferase
MLDYDLEAQGYDASRGGAARAVAAAAAVRRLLGGASGLLVDLAGGTGIVAAELASSGYAVVVADRSRGMLKIAEARLPGRVLQSDAASMPMCDGSAGAVTSIWLLHLLEQGTARQVVAEAARLLRPGGRYLTTVDKAAAQGSRHPGATDRRDMVERMCRLALLEPVGETTFTGHGQGRGAEPDPEYTLLAFGR